MQASYLGELTLQAFYRYSTGYLFDLESERTVTRPFKQTSPSPLSSAAVKIKDGDLNIRQEYTEHSLAKITPDRKSRLVEYRLLCVEYIC